MDIFTATSKVLTWFSKNDSFIFERDCSKLELSINDKENNEASIMSRRIALAICLIKSISDFMLQHPAC